eukprot:scaffold23908_cov36-Tisochrysis_lutea.AAC.3
MVRESQTMGDSWSQMPKGSNQPQHSPGKDGGGAHADHPARHVGHRPCRMRAPGIAGAIRHRPAVENIARSLGRVAPPSATGLESVAGFPPPPLHVPKIHLWGCGIWCGSVGYRTDFGAPRQPDMNDAEAEGPTTAPLQPNLGTACPTYLGLGAKNGSDILKCIAEPFMMYQSIVVTLAIPSK